VSGSSPTQEAIEQIKQRTDKGLPEGFESEFNLTPPAAVGKKTLSTRVALALSSKQKKTNISTVKCQKKFNKILLASKIVFNSSSAVIKKSSYKTLKQLADIANQCTSYNIHVHGHTDTTGRNQLNQRLSKKRAQAVANYLTKKGVNPKHVHAIGHGSSKPVAGNNTSEGRARNRRIELTVED
jgi:outer membrane protein OmpA-like peptidoglycan-associated protein